MIVLQLYHITYGKYGNLIIILISIISFYALQSPELKILVI